MKACKICGRENEDRAKFCGGCGARFSTPPSEMDNDDFDALFKLEDTADAVSADDLFKVEEQAQTPVRSAPATGDDIELGARELERLFESPDEERPLYTESDPDELHEIFTDNSDEAPAQGKKKSRDPADVDDGLDEAFSKLLEQQKAHEEGASGQALDISSPAAGLVANKDVLAEARRELEKPDEEAPETQESVDPELVGGLLALDEPQQEQERRRALKSARSRPRMLPSSLARAAMLPKATFIGRLAGFVAFMALSGFCGLMFRSFHPELPLYTVGAVPAILLILAAILKSITKADSLPLPFFNTMLLFLFVFLVFDPFSLISPIDKMRRLRPFVMTAVFIAGIHHLQRSRLLHRVFRYALCSVGVYALCGLLTGLMHGQSYAAIISRRQIFLQPDTGSGLIHQLARAFEPTFVGVNLFIPVVIIVLVFEAGRLFLNRFFGFGASLLAVALMFAFSLYANLLVYERHHVPCLKNMGAVYQTQLQQQG